MKVCAQSGDYHLYRLDEALHNDWSARNGRLMIGLRQLTAVKLPRQESSLIKKYQDADTTKAVLNRLYIN